MALIAGAVIGLAVAAVGIGRAVLEQRDDEAKADAKREQDLADAIAKAGADDQDNDDTGNFWNGMGEFFGQVDDAVMRVVMLLV